VPNELKDYQFSGTINLNNKDSAIQLAECFLINMDELENMNPQDIGKLKQVITQGVIRVRRPYAQYSEGYVRRASFTGSVNSAQFLNDATGSRRFLSFEVKNIKYMHTVNINLVYAQALALYRSGFKYYFDKKTTTIVNSKNETFALQTPEEEYLLSFFEPVPLENADTFMNASRIIEHIEKETGTKFKGNANISMGKVLQKHCFVKTKRKGIYVYAVKEREVVP
jgi:predicted P-loop ATPase